MTLHQISRCGSTFRTSVWVCKQNIHCWSYNNFNHKYRRCARSLAKDSLPTKLLRLFALSLSLPNLTSSGETNLLGVWTADKPDNQRATLPLIANKRGHMFNLAEFWLMTILSTWHNFFLFVHRGLLTTEKGLSLKIPLPSIRAINNSLLKATLHTWFNLVFTLLGEREGEREKSIGFVEISELYATPSCTPCPIFGILSPQLNSAEQLNHEVKRKSQNPPQKIWDPPPLYRP